MDSKKSNNKISEIVRLLQILKKWKKLAVSSTSSAPKNSGKRSIISSSNTNSSSSSSSNGSSKGIKFLKRTLSFSDVSSSASSNHDVVPKGFLAICVGKELKRYVIPTEYLGHQAFGLLLREAEEEFGFQQEGVLKIPCEVSVFEKILKVVEGKRDVFFLNELGFKGEKENMMGCCSPEPSSHHHPQTCR